MAHRMFPGGLDFAKGFAHAIGHENRIVAETACAARRKGEMAVHLAFEDLRFFPRLGHRQRANEFGGKIARVSSLSVRVRCVSSRKKNPSSRPPSAPNRCPARHRAPRPPNRNRPPVQAIRSHSPPRALSARRCLRRCASVSSGSGKSKFGCAFGLDAERREQFPDLAHLAGIVACNNERGPKLQADRLFLQFDQFADPLASRAATDGRVLLR